MYMFVQTRGQYRGFSGDLDCPIDCLFPQGQEATTHDPIRTRTVRFHCKRSVFTCGQWSTFSEFDLSFHRATLAEVMVHELAARTFDWKSTVATNLVAVISTTRHCRNLGSPCTWGPQRYRGEKATLCGSLPFLMEFSWDHSDSAPSQQACFQEFLTAACHWRLTEPTHDRRRLYLIMKKLLSELCNVKET
jgi:hypothetical protein